MRTVDMSKCVEGIFIQELKNRFLCEVLISNISTVCYVPSSCHLSNFLSLQGKRVLLIPTAAPNARTRFALFAIPYKRSYIILNTSMANHVIKNSIRSRRFSYLGKRNSIYSEHYVGGYKSDLFIKETNTIIEIKSVLATEECAQFPTVFSERSILQLQKLRELLSLGYHVHYVVVSLNPYIKSIILNKSAQFTPLFIDCINLGMTISAFTCQIKNYNVSLRYRIPIRVEDNYG